VLKLAHKLWRRARSLFPITGFHFDRPIVILQSDDWGRVGLCDREGLGQLRSAGIQLGERPYDFYTLETADDLAAICEMFERHRDSVGRHPCLGMNFILANLDFARMRAEEFRQIYLVPLAEGFPEEWKRPGLVATYRQGIAGGVFYPALHGTMHFCRAAVERNLARGGERAELLRTLWGAGTPYIHWRMPWIGYEYWDPEKSEDERFLSAETQRQLIGEAVGAFAKMFSTLPRSACAPGYRANEDTRRGWAQHGIRIAQNGPGALVPPHFDEHGLLQVFRTVEFEPALNPGLSVESCLQQAAGCFERGLPAVVSVHSINFHSTAQDFRTWTLQLLDEFFAALESKYADLLYLHDEDLYNIVSKRSDEVARGGARVNVTQKRFSMRYVTRQREQ
jgi:hypothetical protein